MNTQIWIVSIDDPVFYGRLYEKLIQNAPSHFAGIVVLPSPVQKKWTSVFKEIKYRLQFWGLWGFLHVIFRYFKARVFRNTDLASLAKRYKIPFYKVANTKELEEFLEAKSVDIVLASLTVIIKGELIRKARMGWINTHCGPLPRYRGMDAPFWSLFHNEKLLGSTIHLISENVDEGPILGQALIANRNKPYFETLDELLDLGQKLLHDFIEDPVGSLQRAKAQNLEEGSYFPKPPAELGKAFRARGGRFV